jgi:hypothetical protein
MTREAEYDYEPKSKKKASTTTPSFQDVQITQLLDQHAQILQFLKQSNMDSIQIIQKLIPNQNMSTNSI